MTALKKLQDNIVAFKKKEPKMIENFEKGFIMKSRLFHNEVEPFLSDAAKNVYSSLMGFINGFNKESDHVSTRQIQGGKLKGSNKLGSATVNNGIKELAWFGVITILDVNYRVGNKYRINEVSLVEAFEQIDAVKIKALRLQNKCASVSEALQLVNSTAFISEAVSASVSEASIDITYIYLPIDIKTIHVLLAKTPLVANFLTRKIRKIEAKKHHLENQINQVFEFWKITFKSPRTLLSEKRKTKIKHRLQQGYLVDDIKLAILNCSKSEYNVSKGYTDLELICRDEVKLDRFIQMTNQPHQNQFSAKPKTALQATKDQWASERFAEQQNSNVIDVNQNQVLIGGEREHF